MQDHEFQTQFEDCTLDKTLFRHYGHLRIAWIYLNRHPLEQAVDLTTTGIKRYATSLGAAHIYHDTLTKTWIYLVHAEMNECQHSTFEEFLSHHQHLIDKDLPYQYYSTMTLNSEAAKLEWVEPDLAPLTNRTQKGR